MSDRVQYGNYCILTAETTDQEEVVDAAKAALQPQIDKLGIKRVEWVIKKNFEQVDPLTGESTIVDIVGWKGFK